MFEPPKPLPPLTYALNHTTTYYYPYGATSYLKINWQMRILLSPSQKKNEILDSTAQQFNSKSQLDKIPLRLNRF